MVRMCQKRELKELWPGHKVHSKCLQGVQDIHQVWESKHKLLIAKPDMFAVQFCLCLTIQVGHCGTSVDSIWTLWVPVRLLLPFWPLSFWRPTAMATDVESCLAFAKNLKKAMAFASTSKYLAIVYPEWYRPRWTVSPNMLQMFTSCLGGHTPTLGIWCSTLSLQLATMLKLLTKIIPRLAFDMRNAGHVSQGLWSLRCWQMTRRAPWISSLCWEDKIAINIS